MADLMTLVGKTYLVKTFGCQMNLHDSERVSGLLDQCGCICVDETDQADIVVFMTCCVRENADQRLYGQASAMVSAPKPPCGRRVVAIGGCIAQRDGEKIRKNIPVADVVFGTSALGSLPELLAEAFADDGSVVEVDTGEEGRGFSADLPSRRSQRFHAWVPIMQGCNNFCTYCIVPYVRGREKSRTLEAVVAECEKLVADGVREITLLGQNVNSYRAGEVDFPELLRRVAAISPLLRVRFATSHPKDMSDRLLEVMAATPNICRAIHLPAQSGATSMLERMNRRYTREWYLSRVAAIRRLMPDCAITTDLIAGFSGETEEEHLQTLSLMREVGYDFAYMFKYSERPGTFAQKHLPDDVPDGVKSRRLQEIIALQNELGHASNLRDVGREFEVLVEGESRRDAKQLSGRTSQNKVVVFDRGTHRVGDYVRVRITGCTPATLFGEEIGAAQTGMNE